MKPQTIKGIINPNTCDLCKRKLIELSEIIKRTRTAPLRLTIHRDAQGAIHINEIGFVGYIGACMHADKIQACRNEACPHSGRCLTTLKEVCPKGFKPVWGAC